MNNTLANGLALLGFLSRTADSFGVSELAGELKLPKSHVHRLLQTLVETGYVVQQPDRSYRIGLRPLEISSALLHHLPMRSAAMPHLHRLAKATGMDAVISIPYDGAGLIVGAIYNEGRQRDPGTAIGSRLVVEGTATGALFAACIPDFAPSTATARELSRLRRDRFAVKDPTLGEAFNGMAAVIVDGAGTVLGALGLSAPGDHFRRNFDQSSILLRTTADQLGAELSLPVSA